MKLYKRRLQGDNTTSQEKDDPLGLSLQGLTGRTHHGPHNTSYDKFRLQGTTKQNPVHQDTQITVYGHERGLCRITSNMWLENHLLIKIQTIIQDARCALEKWHSWRK